MAAGDVADEVVQRLRDGGVAGVAERAQHLVDRPPGVEAAAHRVLVEPVDGGAAPRLDVGHQPHEGGQPTGQRTGGDRGQVGLEQHVLDRFGQVRLHRGREVGVGAAVEQRPTGARDRAAAGHAQPLRLAQHCGHDGVEAGRHPARPVPAEGARDAGPVGGQPGLGSGQLVDDVLAQATCGGPVRVGPEGVDGARRAGRAWCRRGGARGW